MSPTPNRVNLTDNTEQNNHEFFAFTFFCEVFQSEARHYNIHLAMQRMPPFFPNLYPTSKFIFLNFSSKLLYVCKN